MKIGILTLPFNNNYGGFLQAYALQTVLENKGHEVIIINRRGRKLPLFKRIKRAVRNLIYTIIKFDYHPLGDPYDHKGKEMHKFVKQHMHLSHPLQSSDELHKYFNENHCDAVIVGSDQLWRPDYVPNVEDYFLGYLPSTIKKIAYAASFGTDTPQYSISQIKSCGDALKDFDIITLREKSGIDVFKRLGWEYSGVKVVLDPTMLLDAEHYKSLVKDYTPNNSFKGKVLNYILDSNNTTEKIIGKTVESLNILPQNIINLNKWKSSSYVFPSIEDWLCAFRDAEFVVTDSFHGTVFSILFHKPFISYVNKDRGADRFVTLLETFGLIDRLVIDEQKVSYIIKNDIDWVNVDSQLKDNRNYFIM